MEAEQKPSQPVADKNPIAEPAQSKPESSSIQQTQVFQDSEVGRKLLDYALENPGTALSICVLTFGGLLLLIYFLRIGFMPDIALESATTLLYAVSVLGLFILTVFASYLVMPAIVAKLFWHDYQQQGKLSVGWALGLSGGAAFLAWFSWIAWVFHASGEKNNTPSEHGFYFLLFFLVPSIGATGIAWWLARKPNRPTKENVNAIESPFKNDADGESDHDKENTAQDLREKQPTEAQENHSKAKNSPIRATWMVAGTALTQWVLMFTVLAMTVGLGQERMRDEKDWMALPILLVPLLFSAAIPFLIQKMAWGQATRWMLGLGPTLLLLLLLVTESFSQPAAIVVSKLGAGEFDMTRVVLSGKGCKQLNQALGSEQCAEAKDDEPTALCPVALRSRIGAQVLIEVAPMTLKDGKLIWLSKDANGQTIPRQRVVLDKSALLAWSTLAPNTVAPATAASAPASLEPASLIYRNTSKALSASTKTAGGAGHTSNAEKPANTLQVASATTASSDPQVSTLAEALLRLCGAPRQIEPKKEDSPDKTLPADKRPPSSQSQAISSTKPRPQSAKPSSCCCLPSPASATLPVCSEAGKTPP